MSNMTNPLAKHFRQPALYLALPSKGRFYPEGSIELNATGTVPIFPMTVRDELALKTPDALLNGQAVVDVIKSCCPSIKDPWELPAIDLDPIFISIRLASYGKEMEFSSTCPHCKETHEFNIDLNAVLDSVPKSNFNRSMVFDSLTFRFKPQKYKNMNRVSMINFEQDKLIQNIIQNETLSEEDKLKQFNISFEKIRQLNIDLIVDSIESVTTEEGIVVSERELIAEFLDSCSRQVYDNIKKTVDELVNEFKVQPLTLTCANEPCGKEFKTALSFDHSNFFG